MTLHSFLLLCLVTLNAQATTWYVAPTGDDAASGSLEHPFASVQRAQQSAAPGDTVYLRGGTYLMKETQAQKKGIYANLTVLDKSGTAEKPITYSAYENEKPVFDCSQVLPEGVRINAFSVSGSWLRLRGLEVIGVQVTLKEHTQSICFESNGSHNIFERLSMHDGQAIGIYHVRGSDSLFLNCDAWNNWDYTSEDGKGGNVDGFGCHPSVGSTGNVLRGCRAWFNSDDGFDLINSKEAVTIENCWALYNVPHAEMGKNRRRQRLQGGRLRHAGRGALAEPHPAPYRPAAAWPSVIRRRASTPTITPAAATGMKNTAYRNGANFTMLCRLADNRTDVDGFGHKLMNNLSYASRGEITKMDASKCELTNNSFGLKLSAQDFVNLDEAELVGPRQANGDLPVVGCLRPAPGSIVARSTFGAFMP